MFAIFIRTKTYQAQVVMNYIKLSFILFTVITLSSCFLQLYKVTPDYKISEINGQSLESSVYEDSLVTIDLEYKTLYYNIKIQNNTNETVTVLWDRMTFAKDSIAEKIVLKNNTFLNINSAIAPTSIPPGLKIEEKIIPINNVLIKSDKNVYIEKIDKPFYSEHEIQARQNADMIVKHNIAVAIEYKGEVKYYNYIFDRNAMISNQSSQSKNDTSSSTRANKYSDNSTILYVMGLLIGLFVTLILI